MTEKETLELPEDFTHKDEVDDIPQRREIDLNEKSIPKIWDEGWHDYVMGHFREDELEKGHPTCDGLRRVAEMIIGPIIERKITKVFPLTNIGGQNNGCIAVSIRILVRNPQVFDRIEFNEEAIADINASNTPDLKFLIHPMAVAETRAEARTLRKILRLRKIIAAEESAEVDEEKIKDLIQWSPEDAVSENQMTAMDIMCQRLDIDVMDFINCGSKKYNNITEITKQTAVDMIKYLNRIQSDITNKPANLKPYNSKWKG